MGLRRGHGSSEVLHHAWKHYRVKLCKMSTERNLNLEPRFSSQVAGIKWFKLVITACYMALYGGDTNFLSAAHTYLHVYPHTPAHLVITAAAL